MESPIEKTNTSEEEYVKALVLGWTCCKFKLIRSLKSLLFEYRCACRSLGKIIKFFAILVLLISAVGLYFRVIETLDNIAELKKTAEND